MTKRITIWEGDELHISNISKFIDERIDMMISQGVVYDDTNTRIRWEIDITNAIITQSNNTLPIETVFPIVQSAVKIRLKDLKEI